MVHRGGWLTSPRVTWRMTLGPAQRPAHKPQCTGAALCSTECPAEPPATCEVPPPRWERSPNRAALPTQKDPSGRGPGRSVRMFAPGEGRSPPPVVPRASAPRHPESESSDTPEAAARRTARKTPPSGQPRFRTPREARFPVAAARPPTARSRPDAPVPG